MKRDPVYRLRLYTMYLNGSRRFDQHKIHLSTIHKLGFVLERKLRILNDDRKSEDHGKGLYIPSLAPVSYTLADGAMPEEDGLDDLLLNLPLNEITSEHELAQTQWITHDDYQQWKIDNEVIVPNRDECNYALQKVEEAKGNVQQLDISDAELASSIVRDMHAAPCCRCNTRIVRSSYSRNWYCGFCWSPICSLEECWHKKCRGHGVLAGMNLAAARAFHPDAADRAIVTGLPKIDTEEMLRMSNITSVGAIPPTRGGDDNAIAPPAMKKARADEVGVEQGKVILAMVQPNKPTTGSGTPSSNASEEVFFKGKINESLDGSEDTVSELPPTRYVAGIPVQSKAASRVRRNIHVEPDQVHAKARPKTPRKDRTFDDNFIAPSAASSSSASEPTLSWAPTDSFNDLNQDNVSSVRGDLSHGRSNKPKLPWMKAPEVRSQTSSVDDGSNKHVADSMDLSSDPSTNCALSSDGSATLNREIKAGYKDNRYTYRRVEEFTPVLTAEENEQMIRTSRDLRGIQRDSTGGTKSSSSACSSLPSMSETGSDLSRGPSGMPKHDDIVE